MQIKDNRHILGENRYYKKAWRKIDKWAKCPTQINHKIVAAFFEAERLYGTVNLTDLHRLYRQIDGRNKDTFDSNYLQMKIDTEKSNGKVFEDDGYRVWIWKEIKSRLMEYKEWFDYSKLTGNNGNIKVLDAKQ